jgi:hypothetical protein
MPTYDLDIQVLGAPEVEARLRKMGDRALLAEPALEKIVGVLRDSEVALFTRGRSWAPNAPATEAIKGRNDPLVRTGALERSLTEENDPNQIVRIEHDALTFGSSLWYAHFAIGTKHQPERKTFSLRQSDRGEIVAILREYILHGEVGLA